MAGNVKNNEHRAFQIRCYYKTIIKKHVITACFLI